MNQYVYQQVKTAHLKCSLKTHKKTIPLSSEHQHLHQPLEKKHTIQID